MRKTFEVEVTTTETRTWEKMIIDVGSRQDEARLSQMRPSPIAPASERRGGDDWFSLFDIIREKPVAIPPGIFLYQNISVHSNKACMGTTLYFGIVHN